MRLQKTHAIIFSREFAISRAENNIVSNIPLPLPQPNLFLH